MYVCIVMLLLPSREGLHCIGQGACWVKYFGSFWGQCNVQNTEISGTPWLWVSSLWMSLSN